MVCGVTIPISDECNIVRKYYHIIHIHTHYTRKYRLADFIGLSEQLVEVLYAYYLEAAFLTKTLVTP